MLALPFALPLAAAHAQTLPKPGDPHQLAPTTSLTHALDESSGCGSCHDFPNREDRSQELPYAPSAWEGTLMANSARDPVFWAGVALAAQDDPMHTQDCIRCHSPRSFLEGRKDVVEISQLRPQDQDGVGCDVCHRMLSASDLDVGNARYHIQDWRLGEETPPPKRGPWRYSEAQAAALKHGWSDDISFLSSSEHCGTCHNVTTPRPWLDENGQQIGPGFPEQRTYTEWKLSAFGREGDPSFQSCQDCHMPAVAHVSGAKDTERKKELHANGARRHLFRGANINMLDFLKQKLGDSGSGQIPDSAFNAAITSSVASLQSAASVTITGPQAVDLRQGLSGIAVRVENKSGHKLPTGYSEGRVMWLEITAGYRGTLVYQSGFWDAQSRSFSQDAQLRRYEGVAQELATGQTLHLLKNNNWRVDTRIPPKGLTPNKETDPVGGRYPLINGAWAHYDDVDYQFGPADPAFADLTPEDASDDTLEITARLLYWINTDEYINVLDKDNKLNDAGATLKRDWQAFEGKGPLELTRASVSVPIVGFPGLLQPDSSMPDATGTQGGGAAVPPAASPSCACTSAGSGTKAWGMSWLALLLLLAPLGLGRRSDSRRGVE